MIGQRDKIEYLMQIPCHARCLVDRGFVSLEHTYHRSGCDSIDDLQHVINKSSSTNVAVRYPALEVSVSPFFAPFLGSSTSEWN